jgi:outer membrane lipoprotein-sorting protein
MTKIRALAVICVLALAARSASGETIDDVKKKIHEKLSSYKTIQYKATTTSSTDSEQVSYKADSTQTIAAMKKGDKVLSRIESVTKGETKFSGQSQKIDSTMLSICDGDYAYDYTEQMGMKNAMKRKVDKETIFNPFDGLNMFKSLESMYTIKLTGEETVNGKPCWVIEQIMKPGPQSPGGKTISYYEKSTAMGIKSTSYDAKGKVSATSNITDIKIDASIPADKFVFKAPAGVEVVDQSELFKKGG